MFLNGFIQSSLHKSEKLVLVAASQKKLPHFNRSKYFQFLYSPKLQPNIYLLKFSSTDMALI